MTTLRRLRTDLARTLFGAPPARPPAQRPRALLGEGLLEDRLPPGDVFWSALDALPASPAAQARVPAQSAPAKPAFAALPESAPATVGVKPATTATTSGQSATTRVASPLPLELPANVSFAGAPAKFVSIAPPAKSEPNTPGAAAFVAAASATGAASANGVGTDSLAAPAPAGASSVSFAPTPASVSAPVATPIASPIDQPISPTPPTRTPVSPDPYHYVADGREVGLTVSPTRVAIGFAAQPVKGAAFAGLSYVRPVTGGVAVYEGAGAGSVASLARLAATPGVAFAVPVFVVSETRTESVLLNEVIVALKPGVTESQYFTGNAAFVSHRPLKGTPDQFVATAAAGRGYGALAAANAAGADPRLAWSAPNFYQGYKAQSLPNDPRIGNEWHLQNTGQSGGLSGADSNLSKAWDVNPGGSSSIVVAVVDDGVPTNHPDLLNWVNPTEDGADADGNGYVGDVNGWNFVQGTPDAQPQTLNDEHGTSVAGVAAAIGNNGIGVAGAAYNSPVMSVRIIQDSYVVTSEADTASALYYAGGRSADGKSTFKGADIINNSWGGGGPSTALATALAWDTTQGRGGVGAAVFFASGNGDPYFLNGQPIVSYPSAYSATIPGVLSVGATNNKGTRSGYSNYGAALDLVTPSGDVRSGYLNIDTTDRVGALGYSPDDYTGTGAAGFSGTSSATPLAVGIGALVLAQAQAKGVTIGADDLRGMLRNDTDLIGGARYEVATGKTLEYGEGRLNAYTAVDGVGKPEISITSTSADLVSGAASLDFGTQPAGVSKDITLRIRNQGTSPLTLNGFTATGGSFAVAGPTGQSLAIGQAATFVVSFTPTGVGSFAGNFTVTSNDADEGNFVIGGKGVGVASQLSGSVFEDWNGDGLKSANDPGRAGRLVYVDTNKNGKLDTATKTYTSSGQFPISDFTTTSGTQTVTGQVSPLTNLKVKLNALHQYDADVSFVLTGPDGTRVLLSSGVGSYGQNFTGTTFDDAATTPVASGAAPFSGTYKPQQSLSAFNGQVANGTWKLEAYDDFFGLTGTVQNWSLVMTSASEPTSAAAAGGSFGFTGLANGAYTLRTATPAGWTATTPATKSITITSPTAVIANVAFGEAKNNRFYGNVFTDTNGDGTQNGAEAALAGRTVFVDANSNGKLDPAATTAPLNTTTATLPYGRPLNSYVTTSKLNVAALGAVTDVNVNLDISHTWDEDLDVTLIAPDGTRVLLFSHVGKNEDNFRNTTLDDQAARVIGSAKTAAPYTGSFKPMGSLADFNGHGASGDWTLEVVDTFPGLDGGALNRWSVTVVSQEQSAVSDAKGNVYFDLPAGPNTVRILPQAGSTTTAPATGAFTVTASGAPVFEKKFGVK